MKKIGFILISLSLMMIFSGCGKEESSKSNQNATNTENSSKTEKQQNQLIATEPSENEMCAFCNMKVYGKEDEMGAFTAQALTSDGKHLFFDDSGCLLNGLRQADEKYEKLWVRDYSTKEWIEKDSAIVIKSDVATPMKYGYSFHSTQEHADQFINEHKNHHPELNTWDQVDQVANERYQMKMKKMNQHSNMEHNNENEHHE
ncbi:MULTISPECIES: nitrous oxide reductase accessory protein NosL [Bacillus]|uniref:nitrous oxide reductase accessory protein NosL n=1 Tax=Bacillus TaxID=1386 RepID=UPI0002FD6403|nr:MULTISPECIES: nitrous oxide reductase accessory protein NosL [Bacillus]